MARDLRRLSPGCTGSPGSCDGAGTPCMAPSLQIPARFLLGPVCPTSGPGGTGCWYRSLGLYHLNNRKAHQHMLRHPFCVQRHSSPPQAGKAEGTPCLLTAWPSLSGAAQPFCNPSLGILSSGIISERQGPVSVSPCLLFLSCQRSYAPAHTPPCHTSSPGVPSLRARSVCSSGPCPLPPSSPSWDST